MNELQAYTASIPDSNPNKAELIRQWKIDNKWGQQEVEEVVETSVEKAMIDPVEEVKIDPVVETDAIAPGKSTGASENSTSGNGKSKYYAGIFSDMFQDSFGVSLDDFKKQEKQKEKLNSVVSKDQTYTANSYDFKWNVNKQGNIEYYQKKEGADDWKLENNSTAIFSIAGELGHLNEEQKKQLKDFKKEKEKAKKEELKLLKGKINLITTL